MTAQISNIFRAVHYLAIIALTAAAVINLITTLTSNTGTALMGLINSILGLILWGFLIVNIWKHPRKWGLGVGIFSLCVSAFQTLLWMHAMSDPKYVEQSLYSNPLAFALYELPLLVGGVVCILLRYMKEGTSHSHAS